MFDWPNPAHLSDLRYALDVMEERSHLGLDDHFQSTLRQILLRRIAEAENSLECHPVAPAAIPVAASRSRISA
jgi:hypothetical protein